MILENFLGNIDNNKDYGNFKYLEIFFGGCTMVAVIPQIYKISSSKMAKDFSMIFIFGMIVIN